MHLIDYINRYDNWQERLTQPPYNLTIKNDNDYYLLKYNQLESDFSLQEVVEARGCIVREDFDGEWIYVCKPFNKFFNYGEPWAAPIDWTSAVVTEKIDGSLMKLWYDYGKWHLSTNSTIDAFCAPANQSGLTFGEIFERILGTDIYNFAQDCFLDYNSTYLFEMTSPETRVVIPYEDLIYYLSRIDNYNEYEYLSPLPGFTREQFEAYEIEFPNQYSFHSLKETIAYAESLPKEEEGFVICDGYGRRIKVKSPSYLRAAHLFKKGNIGKADILQMIKENTIDDFIAYFPEYKYKALDVRYDILAYCKALDIYWDLYGAIATRKEFAEKVKNFDGSSLLFKKYTNSDFDMRAYILNEIGYKKLASLLGYK